RSHRATVGDHVVRDPAHGRPALAVPASSGSPPERSPGTTRAAGRTGRRSDQHRPGDVRRPAHRAAVHERRRAKVAPLTTPAPAVKTNPLALAVAVSFNGGGYDALGSMVRGGGSCLARRRTAVRAGVGGRCGPGARNGDE